MPKKSKSTTIKIKTKTKTEPGARADQAADALLAIHQGLWPENYDAEHEDSTEWNSGTIEWVAADIERALRTMEHPEACFTKKQRPTPARIYCRETLSGPECCPLYGRPCGCPGEQHR